MKSLGGYFQLELDCKREYHKDAIRLNTGRNAFEYLLRAKKIEKIYIPYFTCDVLLEPIEKLKIPYDFYNINSQLEPIFEFNKTDKNHFILYTNYFGLKDEFISKFIDNRNIIIDNAQSFFSKPLKGIDTFYSARKFFGVPDGAYLYTNTILNETFNRDISFQRFEHLLRRIDTSPEDGYPIFIKNDRSLSNKPILEMSNLTKELLGSINYEDIAAKRRLNYFYLEQHLDATNHLKVRPSTKQVPMVYPYWGRDKRNLRKKLVENRIYTATYWPNVTSWTPEGMLEHILSEELIHLPIDQRYGENDLQKIIDIILYA